MVARLFLFYAIVGISILSGCSSSVVENDGVPVAQADQDPLSEQAVEDEDSILAQAASIIDQAKESGSSQAEVASQWLSERMQDVSDSTSQAAGVTGEWATETFQYLKDQGLTTANSTQEWLSEDIQNMGAWHYKVVTLDLTQPTVQMEVTLNELGKERWECFHVLPSSEGQTTLFFKKSRRSYLKSIPFKDAMRLLPLLGSGGGDDGGE